MLQDAQKKVEESGGFERAENSMKNRMYTFLSQFYDMRKYSLRFVFVPNHSVSAISGNELSAEVTEAEAQCA